MIENHGVESHLFCLCLVTIEFNIRDKYKKILGFEDFRILLQTGTSGQNHEMCFIISFRNIRLTMQTK